LPTPPQRIGLFGGSFDPPHAAHVALAQTATHTLALDRLLWIPAGQPWQKARKLTPAAHREAMVRLALEGQPTWAFEDCELRREGPSYMIDTVMHLQGQPSATQPAQWFLIIGQDQLARLHTWHRFEELVKRVSLAVAGRPGQWMDEQALDPRVSQLPRHPLPLPTTPLSSTALRERLASGHSVDGLVPPAVANYIARHRLYVPGT
jgi:nicotinate-nucleotide adenylyltransferase